MKEIITRRRFLHWAALAGGLGIAGAAGTDMRALAAASPQKGKRKNILFIISDDLKPMLNCYDQKQVISPNIDRLAQSGMVFDNAFCQYPVCGPSRQSFLSGMRPNTTGVYGNELIADEQMRGLPSLPKHFRDNGYYTLSVGKVYHNPMHQDLDAWSTEPQAINTHVYNLQKNIDKMAEIEKRGLAEGKPWGEIATEKLVAATEDADVADDAYMPGRHTKIAIEELKKIKERQSDQPFFMALGYFRPHYPFNAPKKYWDYYDRDKLNLATNPFLPQNAKHLRIRNWEATGYGDIPEEKTLGDIPIEIQRRFLHGYYACVSYVDAQIGKVLAALDELGMRDDTIIVLVGDHGFHLGDHLLWGKFTHFEEAARTPMIFSVPGMAHTNKHTPALAELVDIYPTLCGLTGLAIPKHCEGVNLSPVLEQPGRKGWKKAAFTQYNLGDAWATSMRTPRYRYIKWVNHATGEHMDTELYDHYVDPQENENIAHYPENQAICAQLEAMLNVGWKGALPPAGS